MFKQGTSRVLNRRRAEHNFSLLFWGWLFLWQVWNDLELKHTSAKSRSKCNFDNDSPRRPLIRGSNSSSSSCDMTCGCHFWGHSPESQWWPSPCAWRRHSSAAFARSSCKSVATRTGAPIFLGTAHRWAWVGNHHWWSVKMSALNLPLTVLHVAYSHSLVVMCAVCRGIVAALLPAQRCAAWMHLGGWHRVDRVHWRC